MKCIRQNAKRLSLFSTFLLLFISVPLEPALAAMLGTEATLDLTQARQSRDRINRLLLREDRQRALIAQGIKPLETKARIDSLSDAEVMRLTDQIDELPAGGSIQFISTWAVVAILVGIVLALIGLTNLVGRALSD